jgi:isoamylase
LNLLRHVVAKAIGLSLNQLLDRARIQRHGVHLQQPDWSDHSHSLAVTIQSLGARFLLHGMFNGYWEPLTFEIPPAAAASAPRA